MLFPASKAKVQQEKDEQNPCNTLFKDKKTEEMFKKSRVIEINENTINYARQLVGPILDENGNVIHRKCA